MSNHRLPVAALALLLTLGCASCSRPEPPPADEPPPPQATQHTELRDAIKRPIDKAKAVEAQVQDAADEQRAAIDAAGG